MSDFGNAITFIGDHRHLCVTKILEHLALSGAAIGVAIAIALPLGIWLGHIHRGSFLAVNVANRCATACCTPVPGSRTTLPAGV